MIRFSIIGVGTAGRARAKAIAAHPKCELVAVYRGRYADQIAAPSVDSLEAAIDMADVVAVCSPNAHHAAHVRAALAAGRHVVVEYPLALDHPTAARLFDLARRRNRVLHVEHIELLGSVASALRAHVSPTNVEAVEVAFDRPGSAAIPGVELVRHNHARLHRVVDCCGHVASIEHIRARPGSFEAGLRLRSGAPLRLRFLQGPELVRHTRIDIHTATSHWQQFDRDLTRDDESMTLIQPASLFGLDQDHLIQRIQKGIASYVSRAQVEHVLEVVDKLVEGEVPRMIAPR